MLKIIASVNWVKNHNLIVAISLFFFHKFIVIFQEVQKNHLFVKLTFYSNFLNLELSQFISSQQK